MYKLLIADDEQWIRQGLREIINWGSCNIHEVWEAADGEDALYKVREFKPDIVIADIRMPEIDGLELSAILREEFPQTKVIIISGYKDFDYARKAVELGVSNYILKPIDENSIIETVKRCIKEIDREREMLREQEIMKRQIKKNIFLLKQEFILSIFEEGVYAAAKCQ